MTPDFAGHARIMALADLVTPMSVRTAVTLRLADHLDAGDLTADDLAARTGTVPRPLRKLLDHLVHLGLLQSAEGRYGLTDLGRLLRRGEAPMGPFDQLDLDTVLGRTELSAVHLLHKVRTGRSVYHGMYGTDLWTHVDRAQGVSEDLKAQLAVPPGFDVDVLLDHPALARARTVVDVGGNTGALVEALLTRHPGLSATLIDLPSFAGAAARRFEAAGLDGRAAAHAQDFFDPLPAGADVYVLSAVLADWDDETAVRLLRNCALAAGDTGCVLVSEVSLTERLRHVDTGMTLWFEAVMDNPDRSPDDLAALAAEAGLKVAAVGQAGTRIVLELHG
ncbi:methyltransferase [Herbidospora cretacea]|uniref:methyltransferase n=1 Tax=Herbidospora cretacea TaxID=28444 RepID=UPI0012DCC3FF|nr:methyltransferase [Herbidospora cretacea]